ncbi:hypothetical protein Ancab_015205 [Ancistrocladus abbreviatus]
MEGRRWSLPSLKYGPARYWAMLFVFWFLVFGIWASRTHVHLSLVGSRSPVSLFNLALPPVDGGPVRDFASSRSLTLSVLSLTHWRCRKNTENPAEKKEAVVHRAYIRRVEGPRDETVILEVDPRDKSITSKKQRWDEITIPEQWKIQPTPPPPRIERQIIELPDNKGVIVKFESGAEAWKIQPTPPPPRIEPQIIELPDNKGVTFKFESGDEVHLPNMRDGEPSRQPISYEKGESSSTTEYESARSSFSA